jgi:ASCH domain
MAIAPGPRVLSIRQPWAWAIAGGRKKVENRSWDTPYRGTVYIHASSRTESNQIDWIRDTFRIRVPNDLPNSAIVAVAELRDVVTRRHAKRFGRWFEGPYGFVFTNVRALRVPIRMHGKLGLFAALKKRVERQVRPTKRGRR